MLSRRQFLRVDLTARHTALPPPWASAAFATLCTRCDACRDACPSGIVVRGDGGFPTLDYRKGECTFCADCVRACPTGALRAAATPGVAPWQRSVRIAADCLASRRVVCRSCGEACAARAIAFAPRAGGVAQPLVDDAACTGCGACVAICPAAAIRVVASPLHHETPRRVA